MKGMRAGNQLWGWWRAVVVGVGGCGCGGLEVAVGVSEGLQWGGGCKRAPAGLVVKCVMGRKEYNRMCTNNGIHTSTIRPSNGR